MHLIDIICKYNYLLWQCYNHSTVVANFFKSLHVNFEQSM